MDFLSIFSEVNEMERPMRASKRKANRAIFHDESSSDSSSIPNIEEDDVAVMAEIIDSDEVEDNVSVEKNDESLEEDQAAILTDETEESFSSLEDEPLPLAIRLAERNGGLVGVDGTVWTNCKPTKKSVADKQRRKKNCARPRKGLAKCRQR